MTTKSPRKKVGKTASAKKAPHRKKASKPAAEKKPTERDFVYVVQCEWACTDYGSGRDDGQSIRAMQTSGRRRPSVIEKSTR